jgi:8-oxo-dGTP pyrophosphatase MutT (NUDIX family)
MSPAAQPGAHRARTEPWPSALTRPSAEAGPSTIIPLLSRALHRIRSTPPRIIASPATRAFILRPLQCAYAKRTTPEPRRAAVALIIRVVPGAIAPPRDAAPPTLAEFFELEWVKDPGARAELLFLRRARPTGAGGAERGAAERAGEAHVAFPGGRTEDGDEGGLYTAMRQTWEEIGIDLAEREYACVGQLDDREITTSLGKRLLMILSPFGAPPRPRVARARGSQTAQCSSSSRPPRPRRTPSRARRSTGSRSPRSSARSRGRA